MTDNPIIYGEADTEIEPGTFAARSWHDLELLHHIMSNRPDHVGLARNELDRRRIAAEARSRHFRKRQATERMEKRTHGWQRGWAIRFWLPRLVAPVVLAIVVSALIWPDL